MKKVGVFFLILVAAIALAGAYGAAHNQISYTVSPEYFTKFKFQQFGLDDDARSERVRASVVGYHASKGMGLPIGVLVGAAGFIHRGYRRMLRISLWSLAVVIGFTLCFGLCGLIYGYLQTQSVNVAGYRGWFIPTDVVNLRRFLCAGYMHNAAYIGGALSVPAAWAFQILVKVRARDGLNPEP
jgi:hypothetical protein